MVNPEGVSGLQSSDSGENQSKMSNDPLNLSNSDAPNAQLTTSLFNGSNFLTWSYGIKMALGAKNKIGFIDGSLAVPEQGSADLQRWIRCDYMVRCWITHSMAPEFSESFMYVASAKDLWEEIQDRFGQSNGPLLFQLKRNLTILSQGNLSIQDYFGKLKRIWDEIGTIEPIPNCSCGALIKCSCNFLKRLNDIEARNRVMQFLLGMNSSFDSAVNHVLAMDPLPNINRAYSLILQFEAQKHPSSTTDFSKEASALAASRNQMRFTPSSGSSNGSSSTSSEKKEVKDYKKIRAEEKEKLLCSFCNMKGHTVDQCFKIVGYPEWYKGKKGKETGQTSANQAEVMDTPFASFENDASGEQLDNAAMVKMYQEMKEMMRTFKGKGAASTSFDGFSGF